MLSVKKIGSRVAVSWLMAFYHVASPLQIPCDLEKSVSGMCMVPGQQYPWKEIEHYIEDNLGLTSRIFGASALPPDLQLEFVANRSANYRMRSVGSPMARINPCVTEVSLEQPYWSKNMKGQLRVIVNHSPFEQFVQVEKCNAVPSMVASRCPGENCYCMQEYRSIRLVAYDPAEDSKGIFMDWFEFPCCCLCKCVLRDSHLLNTSTTLSPDTQPEYAE